MLAAGTTAAAATAAPQAPVNLGSASNFTVLSKSGITDVFKTSIDGNVGTSPITGAAIGSIDRVDDPVHLSAGHQTGTKKRTPP